MAGELGGKGVLWVPRAESSEEEVTGMFRMVLSLETKMMTHKEKAPSPISSNFWGAASLDTVKPSMEHFGRSGFLSIWFLYQGTHGQQAALSTGTGNL